MAGAARRGSVAGRQIVTRMVALSLVIGTVFPVAQASASHYGDTEELTATTAVGAAIAFSKQSFPDGAVQALLGRDDVFADSLASGSLQSNKPLLLTRGDSLSAETDTELKRLGTRLVHILGGTGAVSRAVEDQLVTAGYAVQRHSGGSRIETAIEIAREAAPDATQVILARAFAAGADPSQAFADSLAAGAWAARDLQPILLTQTEALSAATAAYITEKRIAKVFIVGGTAAVSDAVKAQVEALGAQVTRVSGPTRFDTAIEIAKQRGMTTAATASQIVMVDGQAATGWASGFAAASYAGVGTVPIVLSNGAELPAATSAYVATAGSNAKLLCAPSVDKAACGAAAEEMGKPKLAQVTLTSASVPRFSRLKGSVAPIEQVASMLGDGCGLSDELVGVGTDGAFEARITAPEGTCDITFELISPSGSRSKQTFEITVTEAAPGTTKPELRKVEVVSTNATHARIRYIFTEPIDATPYLNDSSATVEADRTEMPKGDLISAASFLLYGPDTKNSVFTAIGEVPVTTPAQTSEQKAAIHANRPVREVDNPRAVVATFALADFEKSTVAAVASDIGSGSKAAAQDTGSSPQTNAPGAVPLRPLTLEAGKIISGSTGTASNLKSITGLTSAGMPVGKFKATFTLDENSAAMAANLHQLVLADGRVIPGESPNDNTAKSREITFDVSKTRTPEGVDCSGDCPTVQNAILQTRRGLIAATATRPLQSVIVTQGGVTTRPDLTTVALDLVGRTATFTFDQDITGVNTSGGAFGLSTSTVDAAPQIGQNPVKVDARSVKVDFPSLTKLVVGAYVGDNVVTSSTGGNAGRSFGISQSFAAGEVLGPQLIGASQVFTAQETNPTTSVTTRTYTVEWRFDREIQTVDPARLQVFSRGGGLPAPDLSGCTITGKVVTCTSVKFEHDGDNDLPGLASVSAGAVTLKHDVAALQFPTIQGSIQL